MKSMLILITAIFVCSGQAAVALPFDQYEKAYLNCIFYPETGRSTNIGKMVGISSCQRAASRYASTRGLEDTDWNYIGCTIQAPLKIGGITVREGSDCRERIR